MDAWSNLCTSIASLPCLWSRSVELVSSTGKRLRRFSLDECHGAPHEFRGVARAELLSVLRAAVPADVIQYNCPVSAVTPLEDGMAR